LFLVLIYRGPDILRYIEQGFTQARHGRTRQGHPD
jgi:hypothetical protein